MDDEIKKLRRIREDCSSCGGTGVAIRHLEGGVKLDDCSCIRKVNKEIALIKSNIPARYRDFDMRKVTKDFETRNTDAVAFVKGYGEKIEDNILKGNGIWFYSQPGLGKSSFITWILKRAIESGHSAYFSRASHLMEEKLKALKNQDSKELIDYIVDKVDILAIEEIEKIYLTNHEDFIPQLFFEFLSDLYDSKKAVLISSNLPVQETTKRFPLFIQDRLRNLANVHFYGKSERR